MEASAQLEAATEQLAEALGQLFVGGMVLQAILIAIAVFLAIVAFKVACWLIKLPFRIVKWMIEPSAPQKRKTDYGYNTVYDNRSDKWEYNERKKRWEPVDKSRMREL